MKKSKETTIHGVVLIYQKATNGQREDLGKVKGQGTRQLCQEVKIKGRQTQGKGVE